MKKLAHAKFNSLPITQGDTEPFQLIKELAWAVTKLLYFSCNIGERVWTLRSGVCWLKGGTWPSAPGLDARSLNAAISWGEFCREDFRAPPGANRCLVEFHGIRFTSLQKKKNKWKNMLQPLLSIFFFCISTASLILNTCIPWNCAMHLNSSLPNLWDLRVMLPCQSSKVSSGVFQTRLSEIHFWEHQTFCSCIYSILLLQQISKTRGNK